MTNRAYAKSNGDGLLCSILCYRAADGGQPVVIREDNVNSIH